MAAGAGMRMKGSMPKQFLSLAGKPLLMWTMEIFYETDPHMQVILVLPEGYVRAWEELCATHGLMIPHLVRTGGKTRFESVRRGIEGLDDDCLVAIHDGVRPLVSKQTIEQCFDAAHEYGNAVPCIEIPESVREIVKGGSIHVDRSRYRLIQTPQIFAGSLLRKAYRQPYQAHFTDDASVVECMGQSIHLVKGNPENIKITCRHDLAYAESILLSRDRSATGS